VFILIIFKNNSSTLALFLFKMEK